ncbi:hypothetical protein ACHQM5_018025 [Ranunculus cassubicifolius]
MENQNREVGDSSEVEQPNEEDWFSALPDTLIHHVLSFVDMTIAVQTSVLSNRWRYVWRSMPVLNFSFREWISMRQGGWPRKKKGFMDFMEQMLVTEEDFHIDKFDLYDYGCHLDESRVRSSVIRALNRHVESLCLNITLIEPLDLPQLLFTSNLKVLKLYIPHSSHARLPSSLCTDAQIQNLELHGVIFPNDDGSDEFSLKCPVLESLKISHCDLTNLKSLCIDTPLLEILKFGNLFTSTDTSCEVRIHTPNLKLLEFEIPSWSNNGVIADYFVDNLSTLVSAYVHFGDPSYNLLNRYSECLVKILHGVNNVQFLDLSASSIKIITGCPELLQRIPDLFPKLTQATVGIPFEAPLDGVLNVLEKFHHLETLTIFWEKYKHVQTVNHVKNVSFKGIFSHLKTIKIKSLSDGRSELKLLEILLKKAIVLEDVIIFAEDPSSHNFLKFLSRVQALPRASLIATIRLVQ